MANIYKSYRSAFVLEQSKLNRLVTILRERFTVSSIPPIETYQVRHADGTFITVETLERLYEFHNSGKKQIEHLEIHIESNLPKEDSSDPRAVTIEFDDLRNGGHAMIHVLNSDPRWTAEAFAAIEEQVERSFKKGFMYNLSAWSFTPLLAVLVSTLGALLALIAYAPQRELATSMWLTKADIAELTTQLENKTTDPQGQQLAILQHQLKNIQRSHEEPRIRVTWPMLLILAPLLVIIAAFRYLLKHCYPTAVFLWGDTNEWYQTILRRRTYVWNAIIASLVIGIFSSLFGLGIDRYFR